MRRLLSSFAVCLLAAFLGCSKSENSTPSDTRENTATPNLTSSLKESAIDACSLLTSEEIQTVQGEPFKETKSERKPDGNLFVSQCYFALPTFSNSISFQIVQRGTGTGAGDPKQVWKEMFHKEQPVPVGEGAKKKEPPERIEGLGDEAFWAGNQKLGALYVLIGNRYIRVSVGGVDDVATKIRKSRDLAQIILKRL